MRAANNNNLPFCVLLRLPGFLRTVRLLLHVASRFDQCFVISGVGKATHVVLNENVLKSFHPLITVPAAVKQKMRVLFFKTDPTTMPAATMIKAKAFKQL